MTQTPVEVIDSAAASEAPVSIRLAALADIAAVKVIADRDKHALGFVHRASLERAITRGELWVACRGGAVVGFCHTYYRRDGVVTVYHVAVMSEARLAGIGRALLVRVIHMADERGMEAIRLKCPADLPANAFYARLGFCHRDSETLRSRPLHVWEMRWRHQGHDIWQTLEK